MKLSSVFKLLAVLDKFAFPTLAGDIFSVGKVEVGTRLVLVGEIRSLIRRVKYG